MYEVGSHFPLLTTVIPFVMPTGLFAYIICIYDSTNLWLPSIYEIVPNATVYEIMVYHWVVVGRISFAPPSENDSSSFFTSTMVGCSLYGNQQRFTRFHIASVITNPLAESRPGRSGCAPLKTFPMTCLIFGNGRSNVYSYGLWHQRVGWMDWDLLTSTQKQPNE